MLIRWATKQERQEFGYSESKYNDYDVLAAIDRMFEWFFNKMQAKLSKT